jgi:hypothetical protein
MSNFLVARMDHSSFCSILNLRGYKIEKSRNKVHASIKSCGSRDRCEAFRCVAWAFGPCIQAVPHHMTSNKCRCMIFFCPEDKVMIQTTTSYFPLHLQLFEKDDAKNWGWFMRWLRKEIIGLGKFVLFKIVKRSSNHCSDIQILVGTKMPANMCIVFAPNMHVVASWEPLKHYRYETVLKTFKWAVKKKKPRKFEEECECELSQILVRSPQLTLKSWKDQRGRQRQARKIPEILKLR